MTTRETKPCTKCGVEKPLTDFSRNTRASDGRTSQCKACVTTYRKGYVERIAAERVEPSPSTTKQCTACHQIKPVDSFSRHRANHDGRQSQCRECVAAYGRTYRRQNRDEIAAYKKKYRRQNRDKIAARDRTHRYRTKYGLSVEQYDAMVIAAGGRCEICKLPPPADNKVEGNRVLHVDHDHETGQVRGLLCSACNRSIGLIGDEHLAAAAAYIEAGRDWRGMSPTPAPIPSVIDSRRNPAYVRDRRLRLNYGIDLERYAEISEYQGGRCAICDGEPRGDHRIRSLCVDHDHETGVVRGLLCSACNKSIGLIGDANLMAAAAYLERTSERVAS